MIGIKSIEVFYSGEKKNVLELPEMQTLNELELEYLKNSGIKTIYDSETLSSYQLAKEASKKVVQGFKEKIEYIIYIKSRIPDTFISSEVTRLKAELKIDAQVITISDLGCVDSSAAINLAKQLLEGNAKMNNILIAYGNKKYASTRFRYPVSVVGDFGVACIVGRTSELTIVDAEIETNGKYWDLFNVEFKNNLFSDYIEKCRSFKEYGFELAIESKNRFTFINNKILANNKLSYKDITCFLMQNISSNAFKYYEELFDIKFSNVCKENLETYGHTGASDILLNLYSKIKSETLKKDDLILIMNNSPVAAWASILIKV